MGITETQLQTWSKQGAIASSESTLNSIKNCIENINWNKDINYKIYPQGSYPNKTNIYGNSDVDLVIEFTCFFSYDLSVLDEQQKKEFDSNHNDAKYSLEKCKESIIKKLKSNYGGNNIVIGNKAILVKGDKGRLDCDVVVCNSYRKYTSDGGYINGILFKTEKDNPKKIVINYPKIHLKNGENKQLNTNNIFKLSVRMFKNIKASMVDKGYVNKDVTPSYFLECLIYNLENSVFQKSTYIDVSVSIINQLDNDLENGVMERYLTQNGQRNLFGSGDQQWNIENARIFIKQLIKFWNEY